LQAMQTQKPLLPTVIARNCFKRLFDKPKCV
jgi:hypothetical protein